ncbi:outer membrane beta-barrel protein [Vibrio sp. CAU 1672]|uniref:outer membrane protein n=1 Tax=Vibrio sp. CAU 1672 TaxID=3032594 RepID=UPI0023DA5F27|nr:outer membrane beta-barrel protein [Vibrio sp. CAU 1672]MDF2154227.1 porin family protein [Vibrio sp. CAU 1672]
MSKKVRWIIGNILAIISVSTNAQILLTPYLGFTGGGAVEDEEKNTYNLDPALNLALAVEAPYESGRLGLFYSHQSTEFETIANSADVHYLQLQSSVYYPLDQHWSSYIGLGVGGSYVNADWADKKYGFSASAFAGMEYELSDNMAITAQIRWLGTVVDNDTSGVCVLPNDGSNCVIKFETDWMNQFQSNIGFTFRF